MHLIDRILEPGTRWYLFGVVMITVAACMATYVIISVTRRSIKRTLETTLEGMRALLVSDAAQAKSVEFRTAGIGEVYWDPDGLIYLVSRTIACGDDDEALSLAERSFDELVQKLAECGIDPHDVEETKRPEVTRRIDGMTVTSSVSVLVRENLRKTDVDKAALALGYTRDRDEDVEMISAEDAHSTAGRRAIEDAVDNAATIAGHLGLPPGSFGMSEVGLDTLTTASARGRISKSARILWRVDAGRAAMDVAPQARSSPEARG